MDEVAAAARAANAEAPENTKRWLLESHVGTLGTLLGLTKLEGFPYQSVVPYALDAQGRPLILIANIATHTKNLAKDPRGSLFVRQEAVEGDPQSGWRITLMGTWQPIEDDDPELPGLFARYHERVPAASDYLNTHGFKIWRLQVLGVRYIAGFGKITWIDGADVAFDPDGDVAAAAPGAIQHMNEDHHHNLLEMLQGKYGLQVDSAEMVSLDRTGFDVQAAGRPYRFSFGREIGASDIRHAVVDVLRRTRTSA